MHGAGKRDRAAIKAACAMAGGGLNNGSTCGIVTGGCMGMVLAQGPDAGLEIYGKLDDYTSWFEERYGSTLCRERVGTEFKTLRGIGTYILTGKVVTKCMAQAGPAVEKVMSLIDENSAAAARTDSADAVRTDSEHAARTGFADAAQDTAAHSARSQSESSPCQLLAFCGSRVLEAVEPSARQRLERLVVAFDGGIGFSGGLCGALATILAAIGDRLGFDPEDVGFRRVMAEELKGLRSKPRAGNYDPWSVGQPVVDAFVREFGSMECRAITGRSFKDIDSLAGYFDGSNGCEAIIEWCARKAADVL